MAKKWSWSSASWSELSSSIERLESTGWTIFSVCPLGGSEYVHIVYWKMEPAK